MTDDSYTWYVMRRFMPVLVLVPLAFTGCVERLISIRSEPSGAAVFIDGQRRGTTPHLEPYSFYGGREVTLAKKGYRTHRQLVELDAPWWQIFPFDLLTDVVIPFTITDRVDLEVVLEKEPPAAEGLGDTLKRANEALEKSRLPADAPR
jgi:PEGA domain-containing protein